MSHPCTDPNCESEHTGNGDNHQDKLSSSIEEFDEKPEIREDEISNPLEALFEQFCEAVASSEENDVVSDSMRELLRSFYLAGAYDALRVVQHGVFVLPVVDGEIGEEENGFDLGYSMKDLQAEALESIQYHIESEGESDEEDDSDQDTVSVS